MRMPSVCWRKKATHKHKSTASTTNQPNSHNESHESFFSSTALCCVVSLFVSLSVRRMYYTYIRWPEERSEYVLTHHTTHTHTFSLARESVCVCGVVCGNASLLPRRVCVVRVCAFSLLPNLTVPKKKKPRTHTYTQIRSVSARRS